MSEYREDSLGQIYTDLAKRIGELDGQYQEMVEGKIPAGEMYPHTLALCLLQTLLTLFDELKNRCKAQGVKAYEEFLEEKAECDELLNSLKKGIRKNEFEGATDFKFFCKHIRDPLSHPLNAEDESQTSFSIVKNDGMIVKFKFIHCPLKNKKNSVSVIEVDVMTLHLFVKKLSEYLVWATPIT